MSYHIVLMIKHYCSFCQVYHVICKGKRKKEYNLDENSLSIDGKICK